MVRKAVTREKISVIAYGLFTHLLFAIAVIVMVDGLYHGLRTGHGPFHQWQAWLVNALLIAQFPLIHSFLLTARGRRLMNRIAPGDLGRDLAPTTYVLVASLQLLATFELWSPTGVTIGDPSGPVFWVFRALFVVSWIFLLKALSDAGIALQTGFIGWGSVARGKRPAYGDFPRHGLFRFCRHPVYLGFALILWTAPVHTLDGLLLAALWTLYCVVGPLHKEGRYRKIHGGRYEDYRASTPYMVPHPRQRSDTR